MQVYLDAIWRTECECHIARHPGTDIIKWQCMTQVIVDMQLFMTFHVI